MQASGAKRDKLGKACSAKEAREAADESERTDPRLSYRLFVRARVRTHTAQRCAYTAIFRVGDCIRGNIKSEPNLRSCRSAVRRVLSRLHGCAEPILCTNDSMWYDSLAQLDYDQTYQNFVRCYIASEVEQ